VSIYNVLFHISKVVILKKTTTVKVTTLLLIIFHSIPHPLPRERNSQAPNMRLQGKL